MKNRIKYVSPFALLFGLMIVFPLKTTAQVVDSAFLKEFNSFSRQIDEEFNTFSSYNDSVFVLFLQNSWKEFEGKQNPRPVSPKPVIQPDISQPQGPVNLKDTLLKTENPDTTIFQGQETIMPEKDAMDNLSTGKSFSFYGNRILLPATNVQLPKLQSISRQGIIDFFSKAGRSDELNEIAARLKEKSDRYRLNDWGYASMLLQAAGTYYYNVNEQLLFAWVALLHQGYNVKVGYSSNRIYLLMPANVQLYTVSYTIGNRDYFVLGPGSVPSKTEKVFIHEANYPGNEADFSFKLTEIPQFGYLETLRTLQYETTIKLTLNKNLLEFYRNYPPCDLEVYFNTPISADVTKQLDACFLPLMEGKNDNERVALLLDYVQRAIKYKTDREQFGKERYLFPDETLYYPGADCEDRSVLFARLINRYTNLDAIGLSYPMHVTIAVALNGCDGSDFVNYNGKRFYHCDPTYLGAECGMAMKSILDSSPEVIYQNF